MESYFEYTWCQLFLIGMACSGPSPAAELTSKETSWTFILVAAMRSRRVGQSTLTGELFAGRSCHKEWVE